MAATGRIGVGAGFNGAPIVSSGDGDGIDTVHYPLVVSSRPVRIDRREIRRDDDSVANPFTRVIGSGKRGVRYRAPGPGKRPVRQIGEDSQKDLSPGNRLDQRRDALAHPVGDVGAHGIAGVHQQVHDQRGLAA